MTTPSNTSFAFFGDTDETLVRDAVMTATQLSDLLQIYENTVTVLVHAFDEENRQIKQFSLEQGTQAERDAQLQRKHDLCEAYHTIHQTIMTAMDQRQFTKHQMETIQRVNSVLMRATTENIAYLQLAEGLNRTLLNLFADANVEMNKMSYDASGVECQNTMAKTSSFLTQNA